MIRPMTPNEHALKEEIIDQSATRILAKLWATMYHLQDLVGISRVDVARWSPDAPGRIDHQPEKVFACDLMTKLRLAISDYPTAWDQHAVDYMTPIDTSFDRECLNAEVRERVNKCLASCWREVEMLQRGKESEKCDG